MHLDRCLPDQQIQRNYKGLKIAACRGSVVNYGQKIQRDQKTQLPFLKSREQEQGTEHAPAWQHHRRGEQNTPAILWPNPWTPLPCPHIRNQLTPFWGVSKGTCYLLAPPAAVGAPIKPSLISHLAPDQLIGGGQEPRSSRVQNGTPSLEDRLLSYTYIKNPNAKNRITKQKATANKIEIK